MEYSVEKDVFISYKNDGSGNQFASRLCQDLERIGYSVYFNPHEKRTQNFPEKLRHAVTCCKDFVLIISRGCLEQLKRNDPIDWVREEILTAQKYEKHIVPILIEGVDFPRDINEMPAELRFLPYVDAFIFPEQYLVSPFSGLLKALISERGGFEQHRSEFNNNPKYRVTDEFSKTLEKAQSGDIESMYEIAMMYYYGVTNAEGNASQWDYERAAYWLKKVAESTSDLRFHAQSTIARMYYQGTMPQESQSYEKAFMFHSMAAEKSGYSAADKIYMMRNGVGCEFDYQRILDFYKENIRKGDDIAITQFAQFFAKHGRFEEALELYDSMEIVSPEADYQIGLLYRDGVISNPPQPDHIRASYYFRNAADNNHIQAAYEYGLLCFRPIGRFRKDFRNAEKYLKIAADGGHAGAQYILGYMYRTGLAKQDLNKAIEYLEKARQQSHSHSALELAMIYQQPECQNYQKAYECAEIAAAHGVAEGELILGNLLFWGRGCKYDMDKAYEMYRRAYEHGMYYAFVMMEKIDMAKTD